MLDKKLAPTTVAYGLTFCWQILEASVERSLRTSTKVF